MLGLWRAKFYEHTAFYGGSALRICHHLNRFSEDLDFSLTVPNASFDIGPYLHAIESELTAFGFTFQAEGKQKTLPSHIESAFIKGNTVKNLIVVEAPSHILRGFHQTQKLKVKLEIDVDPPEGADYETKFLL